MKPTLTRGSLVHHKLYGLGSILSEWGSWFSCRGCYVELYPSQLHKIMRNGKQVLTGQCDDCKARSLRNPDPDSAIPLQVSGKGTFDALFADGKTRAINQHWLHPIEEEQAA